MVLQATSGYSAASYLPWGSDVRTLLEGGGEQRKVEIQGGGKVFFSKYYLATEAVPSGIKLLGRKKLTFEARIYVEPLYLSISLLHQYHHFSIEIFKMVYNRFTNLPPVWVMVSWSLIAVMILSTSH